MVWSSAGPVVLRELSAVAGALPLESTGSNGIWNDMAALLSVQSPAR